MEQKQQKKPQKHRKSDILWKVVMEEVFSDLLRFVYPDAEQVYDMKRGFEFLEKELAELYPEPDKKKDSRFADKLVKVYHRDGIEEWVLLHVEIQGDTRDRQGFAERMYEYFTRIRLRHRKRVSALAIFTGQDGKNMPDRYCYDYRGTKLTYEFPTMSILDFSNDELEKSDNPFAHVMLAAKISLLEKRLSDERLLEVKLLAANKLQDKGFGEVKITAVFNFLRNYVLFKNPKINRKFDEEFKRQDKYQIMNTLEYVAKENREVGRRVGRKEGVVEGLKRSVIAFLTNTDFSIKKIAEALGVSTAFVKKVNNESKVR